MVCFLIHLKSADLFPSLILFWMSYRNYDLILLCYTAIMKSFIIVILVTSSNKRASMCMYTAKQRAQTLLCVKQCDIFFYVRDTASKQVDKCMWNILDFSFSLKKHFFFQHRKCSTAIAATENRKHGLWFNSFHADWCFLFQTVSSPSSNCVSCETEYLHNGFHNTVKFQKCILADY